MIPALGEVSFLLQVREELAAVDVLENEVQLVRGLQKI